MGLIRLIGFVVVTCLVMFWSVSGNDSCQKLENTISDKLLDTLCATKLKTGENTISDMLLDMLCAIKSDTKIGDDGITEIKPAFSLTLLQNTISLSKIGTILKFDNVILNRGNAYNITTGQFTAPLDGLYQFSATVMSYNGADLNMGIYRNGKVLMKLYGPNINGATETANPVLELTKGDMIDVRHTEASTRQVIGKHYTHMSGFYIGK